VSHLFISTTRRIFTPQFPLSLTERKGKLAMIPLSFATIPANKILSSEQKAALKDAFRQTAKGADHPLLAKMVELQLGWLDNDEVALLE